MLETAKSEGFTDGGGGGAGPTLPTGEGRPNDGGAGGGDVVTDPTTAVLARRILLSLGFEGRPFANNPPIGLPPPPPNARAPEPGFGSLSSWLAIETPPEEVEAGFPPTIGAERSFVVTFLSLAPF